MFDSYSVRIDLPATGNRIKELRYASNYTVAQLAEILHSSENTIFKWQRGECLPTLDNLLILSMIFETPMDDIIQCDGRGAKPLLPINQKNKVPFPTEKHLVFLFSSE